MAASTTSCLRFVRLLYALAVLACLTNVSAKADTDSAQYKLGPEDVISIIVLGHEEFSGQFFIPSDGVINVPVAGRIKASGKTVDEIYKIVTEKLCRRLKDPEVTVSLSTPRMSRIYVNGEVKAPGSYDMKPGWRITEAVAAAGGLVPGVDAVGCKVTIIRSGAKQKTVIDLESALKGSSDSNVSVESGDVLLIESEETFPIYVLGKVRNPGFYRLRKKSSGVMEALSLAGGTLDEAALSKVTVTHNSGGSEQIDLSSAVSGDKNAPDVKLVPGDLVVVPEVTSRIAILGYVKEPGFYPLKDGQKLTLADALGLAKGTEHRLAKIDSVAVIRMVSGKQVKTTYNLGKFLKDGDLASNPNVLPGDVIYVPNSGRTDWDVILRAISSVGIFVNPLL